MKPIKHQGFEAVGYTVRTNNSCEMNQATAKIGKLWSDFYNIAPPFLKSDSKIFGVYTNYETDVSGSFDVIACSDALCKETSANTVKIIVPPGKYVKFSAAGQIPRVVIELWQNVWEYFNRGDCPYERAYINDFEQYTQSKVEIFISIK